MKLKIILNNLIIIEIVKLLIINCKNHKNNNSNYKIAYMIKL
jgi:hypothetical protein